MILASAAVSRALVGDSGLPPIVKVPVGLLGGAKAIPLADRPVLLADQLKPAEILDSGRALHRGAFVHPHLIRQEEIGQDGNVDDGQGHQQRDRGRLSQGVIKIPEKHR